MIKGICTVFLCCATLLLLVHNGNSYPDPGGNETLSFDSGFYSPLAALPDREKPTGGIATHQRRFRWIDPTKKRRETLLEIPAAALKKEVRSFGIPIGGSKEPFYLKKRGFEVVSRRNFVHNSRVREGVVTVVDYRQLFKRNLNYFPPLTRALMESAQIPQNQDPLYSMLSFVQHISYQLPPQRYNGRFINSFFVPLVVLYEKYGDCDSKSMLLAEFLSTAPAAFNKNVSIEKTGLVLIRGNGLAHAVLAVKRKPLPGMMSLYDMKRGEYILVETTRPGWAPGFISRRVLDTIKAGFFRFVALN
ncbi:MAG: hypothetical protein GY940_01885 [bacterium]|nr:hypothetical protein [bacterium]